MNLETEQFRLLLTDFKRGKSSNIFSVMDQTLCLIDEELIRYPSISEPMVNICLLALISSIRLYSYEKAAPFTEYAKNYIHLSLLVAEQTNMFIEHLDFDLAIPSLNMHLPKEMLQEYISRIQKAHALNQEKLDENTKILKKQ